MRRLVSTILAAAVLVASPVHPVAAAAAAPVATRAPVVYRPPVDARVVDRFRPPAHVGGAGNLGVDYATAPGTPVRAAAAGTVAFAGQVGGRRHVVVLHADGLRTTYAFLATVAVARGDALVAGAVVGTAGPTLHFGVRAAGEDAYLDPLVLLAGGARELRLVPDGPLEPESEARERGLLERFLRAAPRAAVVVGATTLDWARQTAAAAVPIAPGLDDLRAMAGTAAALAVPVPLHVAVALKAWADRRGSCTPTGLVPPRPPGPRIAVLVAGLGSTSQKGGIDDVDTAALGYADGDVVRFSYRGGTTDEVPYDAADTQVDMAVSGRRLRALLEDLQEAHPGVAIDVIAHSQGGLVARAALGRRAPPAVRTLVTLATPHGGSDIATFARMIQKNPIGAFVGAVASDVRPLGVDPHSTAVRQLVESSTFLRRLDATPLPPGVHVTSVSARADPVVTSPKARLGGADNVVVTVGGLDQHGGLPGSPAARREIALAVAGLAPTCEGLADALADAVVGETITTAEDLATGAAVVAQFVGPNRGGE